MGNDEYIDVPVALSTKKVRVTAVSITDKKKTLMFADVKVIRWSITRATFLGIPLYQNYKYTVRDNESAIKLGMETVLTVGNRQCNRSFNLLTSISEKYIIPVIAHNYFRKLNNGEKVKIGSTTLSRDGLVSGGFFKAQIVPWREYLNTDISGGYLRIFAGDEGRRSIAYSSNNLGSDNVVVIPALLDLCVKKWG